MVVLKSLVEVIHADEVVNNYRIPKLHLEYGIIAQL